MMRERGMTFKLWKYVRNITGIYKTWMLFSLDFTDFINTTELSWLYFNCILYAITPLIFPLIDVLILLEEHVRINLKRVVEFMFITFIKRGILSSVHPHHLLTHLLIFQRIGLQITKKLFIKMAL